MNAGDLGVRVDDLEKANESVAVRLSKLRRGGSVKSTASSFNSDPGAKYFFFSSCSLKMRKRYISFAQLVLLSLYIFLGK